MAEKVGFERCGIARAEPIGRPESARSTPPSASGEPGSDPESPKGDARLDAPKSTSPRPSPGEYLKQWLAAGHAGTMDYLHRYQEQRLDPRLLLPGARSIIVVAQLYHQPPPDKCRDPSAQSADPAIPAPSSASPYQEQSLLEPAARGRVAMYAWGRDYHKVIRGKLWKLVDGMRDMLGETFEARVCVDTAPILEREVAAAAGIGWIGKNTLVLHEDLGSYFFLGAIVTTLDLAIDRPVVDHCGTCTACLDACPTDAFPAPYQMDASRCISYLTIEHRGDISQPFQELMGDWVFGCDICQEVCPFNRRAPFTTEPQFAVRSPGPAPLLDDILRWSADDYQKNVAGSAVRRATLPMLQRNAAAAAANLREHDLNQSK